VLVFDTADAWGRGERLNPLPGQWLVLDRVADLVDFFRDNRRGPFRILFKCDAIESVMLRTFLEVCRLVRVVRDIVFVVDEVWEFCDAEHIPEDFGRLILRGRTPGVTVLWAAQFPATISRRLTGASTEMRIFRLVDEADLTSPALKSRVGKDVRALLPRLPDRYFVQWFSDRPWRVCVSDLRGNLQPVDLASFRNSVGLSSELVPV
jgi:hypothetical protein